MAGNVDKQRNLQNQQDLEQQQQARGQNAQSAEFSSSIPEYDQTEESDVEFVPSQELKEQIQEG
ncbi:MAG: hypothetical protein ACLGIN_03115 [Candidatus Sericytochromatia bacterium]